MTNLEKYSQIFMEVFEVEKDVLGEKFVFGEVAKWDSLAHMTLISELEDAFDVMFETEDMINYHSYENGIRILKKYGVNFDE